MQYSELNISSSGLEINIWGSRFDIQYLKFEIQNLNNQSGESFQVINVLSPMKFGDLVERFCYYNCYFDHTENVFDFIKHAVG
jgi:hypothetical protein